MWETKKDLTFIEKRINEKLKSWEFTKIKEKIFFFDKSKRLKISLWTKFNSDWKIERYYLHDWKKEFELKNPIRENLEFFMSIDLIWFSFEEVQEKLFEYKWFTPLTFILWEFARIYENRIKDFYSEEKRLKKKEKEKEKNKKIKAKYKKLKEKEKKLKAKLEEWKNLMIKNWLEFLESDIKKEE